MAVTINGDGTISGINVGGLPDGVVDSGTLATGIDATKLADGTVTSAELQYINTLSSNAQTQISGVGGGAWNYIATATASDSASLDFTSNIDSTYSVYVFMLKNVMLGNHTSYNLQATLYAGSWLTSNYSSYTSGYDAGGTRRSAGSTSDSQFWLADNQYTTSAIRKGGVSGYVYLIDPSAGTSVWHTMSWNLAGHSSVSTGYPVTQTGSGVIVADTAAVTGVSFKSSSGNLITGEIRMYGIADS